MIRLLFLSLILSACASSTVNMPGSTSKFRHTLRGDINGTEFIGTAIIPLSEDNKYLLHVTSDVDVEKIIITTCHRDWDSKTKAIQKPGFLKPGKDFIFEYEMSHGIEDWGTCLLKIGAYNESGEPQEQALLDFETPESTLPAFNKCDGVAYQTNGVSICESKAGLDQEIDFDVPVWISPSTSPQCKPIQPKDGKHWLYVLPAEECVVYFDEQAPPHRKHRHTFTGYVGIQVKEN